MRHLLIFVVLAALGAGCHWQLSASEFAHVIQQTEKAPDLKKLLADLKSQDDLTKLAALRELVDFGPQAAPAIDDLVALVQSKNEDLRLNAAIVLGKIGKPSVPNVAQLLNSEDEDTRFYALSALGWIGPDAADASDAVIKALSDKSDSIRRKAAYALGRVAPKAEMAVGMLIAALDDASDDVRLAASEALGKLGALAVPALIEALKEKKEPKSIVAAHALGDIGQAAKDSIPILKSWLYEKDGPWRHEAQETLGKLGKAAIPVLVEASIDANESIRLAAMQALGQIGADAVPDLVDALGSKHVDVRRSAALALMPMRVSDKMVILALAFGLKDEDEQVRRYCIQGLQLLGSVATEAAPKLREALLDVNAEVRLMAFYALSGMNENPLEALKIYLGNKDARTRIVAAALLITTSSDKEAIPVLMAALQEKDIDLRMQAASTLALRRPNIKELAPVFMEGLKSKSAGVRQQALQGLQLVGPGAQAAAPELLDIMQNDPDPRLKEHAMHALQSVGGDAKEVLPALKKMLNSDDASVRLVAVQVVWKFGSNALPLLVQRIEDKDERVRKQAAWALYNVQPDKNFLPLIRPLLKHKEGNVRQAAVQLLIRSSEVGAEEVLALLGDPNENVRWTAFHSLRNMGKGIPDKMGKALAELVKSAKAGSKERGFAIQALAQLGPEGWPTVFEALKTEKDPDVRANTIVYFGSFGAKSRIAVPVLIEALKDTSIQVRFSAIQALQNIGPTAKAAIPALRELLNDPDQNVRNFAQTALNVIGQKN